MRVVIASGKGGTGKTSVAASLAHIWPRDLVAVDLDVEEPNLHLFLHPDLSNSEPAYLMVPELDESLCTHCGACSDLCQFKAVSLMGEVLLAFPEMCHGCGGCVLVCPTGALTESRRELGQVRWGQAGDMRFVGGNLRVGEAMSPPLMRQVHAKVDAMLAQQPADVLADGPPGVSCPAVNAVSGADVILLVTEPTPFGCFDLDLAIKAFSGMGAVMGVVVNRAGLGDESVYKLCARHQIPIWAEIPYSRSAAQAYCAGKPLCQANPEFTEIFTGLANELLALDPAGERKASVA